MGATTDASLIVLCSQDLESINLGFPIGLREIREVTIGGNVGYFLIEPQRRHVRHSRMGVRSVCTEVNKNAIRTSVLFAQITFFVFCVRLTSISFPSM